MSIAPADRRRSLPFGRRLAITLVATALLPLVVFGAFSIGRIETALRAETDARVQDALGAVASVMARRQQDLAETTTAYATWSVTRTLIDDRAIVALERDVLGFLETRGSVDVAIAVVDGRPISTRPEPISRAIANVIRPSSGAQPPLVAAGGDLYQVAVAQILGADAAPSAPVPDSDWMVFARRLDAEFTHEVNRLTGFDLAVIDADGTISVASDPTIAARFVPTLNAPTGIDLRDGLAAGWVPVGPGEPPEGVLLVTTRLESVRSLLGQLPAILLASLGLAAVLAALTAWVLGRSLNERLASIHDGLAAMAAGRRPVPGGTSAEPGVERLASALDALIVATDRRDRVLRDVSTTVAGIRPEQGVELVARAAADGARDVFGLRWCRIARPDDAEMHDPQAIAPSRGPGRRVEAPLETAADGGRRLVGMAPVDGSWTEADEALFGLYARLVGSVLRDAHLHDATSDRLVRLGHLNELQREFLRSVSHNLQTPLTTIVLLADDLAESTDAGDPGSAQFAGRRVEAIRVEARRLERLVAQLLTVSRLDAGRVRLEREAVAIAPAIRRVWAGLGVDRPFELEDATHDLIAVGDRNAIEQILWILLDNAIRYAPDGPIQVRTRAASSRGSPMLQIEVEDRGPGVDEADRRHIFRRFWSGAAGRERGGTGIGLDIARRLARAMAGSVTYRPARPGGSLFVVTLPADIARPD